MPLKCKFRALFPDFHPEMRGGERGSAHATSSLHRLRVYNPAFNTALGYKERSTLASASSLSLLTP